MASLLASGKRTPVGRYGGALATVRPDDMAALVIRAVVEDSGIPPEAVDEVIMGNANGAGEENRNVARMAWLLNGYPDTVPGFTVNRLCGSGLTAISTAAALIDSGQADVVVAGGVESMTRAPWVTAKPAKAWAAPGKSFDTSLGWRFVNPIFAAQEKTTFAMTETAEEVARRFGITREEADAYAVESQARANRALELGLFDAEIVAVGDVSVDEGPRSGVTMETLARLRPVVTGGEVVTAGNSSSLNDGASAILVLSEKAAQKYGVDPRARVVSSATVGLAPEIMGLGPIESTRRALHRAGWSVDDVDAVEINEAFATQSLESRRQLGFDPSIVNAWGGAIALGHPLGSSGSRIVVTLLNRMEREGASRGVATLCIGVGQGQAVTVERV